MTTIVAVCVITAIAMALVVSSPTIVDVVPCMKSPVDFYDVIDTVTKSVVLIEADSGSGSGFIISDHMVVTARHVVKDTKSVKITTYSGEMYKALMSRISYGPDCAILFIAEMLENPVIVERHNNLRKGERIFSIGAPFGGKFLGVVTVGRVGLTDVNVPYFGRSNGYIISDILLCPGNSGGPIFDGAGRVVGIAVGLVGKRTFFSVIVPIESVKNFLNGSALLEGD